MFSLTYVFTLLGPQAALGALEFSPALISAPAQQITTRGYNHQALFLDDENILFISKKRHRNEGPQIYLKNLSSGDETQITHQRGELQMGVVLAKSQQMVYASSTDEDKESPLALRSSNARVPSSLDPGDFVSLNLQPQELYLSSWDGSQVERLTFHPGFDGTPSFRPSHQQIYFSRNYKGLAQLYSTSLRKIGQAWPVLKSEEHDLGLDISPDGKHFVWSRFDKDFNHSQLLLSTPEFKGIQKLTAKDGLYWGARFHTQRPTIVFSAKRGPMSNFDLFEMDLKGECYRQLTAFDGDESFPQVSPDGKKIMFTSSQAGGEQIFMIDDPQSPLDCQPEVKTSKDKKSPPSTEAA